MQGIIQSGMRAEGGARPQQPARPAENRPAEDGVNMNPETAQQQRNVLVNGMLGQLYGDRLESAGRILRQSQENPVEGIGRIVSGLIGAAYKTVKDDGRTVPPGVLFQAGMIAAQAVGEMADRMGIIDQDRDSEVVESGFMMALAQFGRANAEQMSDQERERYGQLIDGMEEGKRMAMEGGDRQPQRGNRQASAAEGDMDRRGGMMMQGGA